MTVWQTGRVPIMEENIPTHAKDIPAEQSADTLAEPLMSRGERRREERRSVEEAGGGEAEGFELAEQELIEHASHGDEHSPARIMRDADDLDEESPESVYGEADSEHLDD
ncbi:MAG TPA: hypothetical protein VN845_11840 [Solirubrobacteraceae bacterium]|nr:hypothetical protein [Solirubrobacteraceae bacterium]